MKVIESLESLRRDFETLRREATERSERNLEQMKVLATVKCSLENILKRRKDIADTIVECVDLLRLHTPHYSVDAGKTIIDPPLTEEEKVKLRQIVEGTT